MDKDGKGVAQPRKSYTAPVLHVYGDVSDITRDVGKTGMADGGKGNDKSEKP
jgi:hypothetical protein